MSKNIPSETSPAISRSSKLTTNQGLSVFNLAWISKPYFDTCEKWANMSLKSTVNFISFFQISYLWNRCSLTNSNVRLFNIFESDYFFIGACFKLDLIPLFILLTHKVSDQRQSARVMKKLPDCTRLLHRFPDILIWTICEQSHIKFILWYWLRHKLVKPGRKLDPYGWR